MSEQRAATAKKLPWTYDGLMRFPIPTVEQSYTKRDTMLYALGLGFGSDPMDEAELSYVYEPKLQAVPTMAVVLGHPGFWIQKAGIDWVKVVHCEQGVRILKPIPPEAHIISRSKVTAIVDKGADKGMVLYTVQEIIDKKSDSLLASMAKSVFCRGDGGFGGPTGPVPPVHEVPKRAPDKTCDIATLPQAALIYRLSGDYNPLHAEPAVGKKAGFPRPILHGLCTYGVAARAVLRSYCGYDASKLTGFDARFSSPVFPGETIRTQMWKDGGVVSFECQVLERPGTVVIRNGRAEIKG